MKANAFTAVPLAAALLGVTGALWGTSVRGAFDEADAARMGVGTVRLQDAQARLVQTVNSFETRAWAAFYGPANACTMLQKLGPPATKVTDFRLNETDGLYIGTYTCTNTTPLIFLPAPVPTHRPYWWAVVTGRPVGTSLWVENDLVLHVAPGRCVRFDMGAFRAGGADALALPVPGTALYTFYPTSRDAAADPHQTSPLSALLTPVMMSCRGAACGAFPMSSRAESRVATGVALFERSFQPGLTTVYPWPRMTADFNGLAVGIAAHPTSVDHGAMEVTWWVLWCVSLAALCGGYVLPLRRVELALQAVATFFDRLDLSDLTPDVPDPPLTSGLWTSELAAYRAAVRTVLAYVWKVVSYVPAATKRASVGWAQRTSIGTRRQSGAASGDRAHRASHAAAYDVPSLDIGRATGGGALVNPGATGEDEEAYLAQLSPYTSPHDVEKGGRKAPPQVASGDGEELLMEYLMDPTDHCALSPRVEEDGDPGGGGGPPRKSGQGGKPIQRGARARAGTVKNKNRGNQAQLRVKKASLLMIEVGILNNNTNKLEDHVEFSRVVIDVVTTCVKRHDGVPVYLNANGILCGWNTHGIQKDHPSQACLAGVALKHSFHELIGDACPWRMAVSCGTVFAGFSGVHGQMLPVVSGEAATLLLQLLAVSDRVRCRLLANDTMADKERVRFIFRMVDVLQALDAGQEDAAAEAQNKPIVANINQQIDDDSDDDEGGRASPDEDDDEDGNAPLSAGLSKSMHNNSMSTMRTGSKAVYVYELVGVPQLDVSRTVQILEKLPPASYKLYNEGFSALQVRDLPRCTKALTDFLLHYDPADYQAYRLLQIALHWKKAADGVPPRPFTRRFFGWAGYDEEGMDQDKFMEEADKLCSETRATGAAAAADDDMQKLKSKIAASHKREEENKAHEGSRLKKDIASAAHDSAGQQQAGLNMTYTDRKGVKWSRSDQMLGTGAFGEVYKGMSEQGALIAMKVLKLPKVQKTPTSRYAHRRKAAGGGGGPSVEQVTEELVNEVNLLTKLRHDNVVAYLASIVAGQFIVICMEFMSGGSLMGLLELYITLPLHAILRYLLDILRGLKFLHDNNIIHRDIKPHNVLLHIDGQSKLSDFGASGQLAAIAGKASVQGTPLYMAPEAARGYGAAASDVWSLGITLLELLTGKVPWVFTEDKPFMSHNFIYRLGNDESFRPSIPDDLPPELDAIIKECLVPDPNERPTCDDLLKSPELMRSCGRSPNERPVG